jgi:hypothetical protein
LAAKVRQDSRPCPLDRALAFLDPLLRRAALVVEGDDALGGPRPVRPVRPSKVVEIIFWHTTRMPDEHRSIQPRRYPEDIDLAAIKTDLEFLMEQVARLPTRQESAFNEKLPSPA